MRKDKVALVNWEGLWLLPSQCRDIALDFKTLDSGTLS